jgi:hypothetical protein
MKVKSTGLGRTQLTAHIDGFFIKEDGSSAVMVIESTEPVHWHIECDMGGKDLRHFAGFVLKPRVLYSLVRLLVTGGEAKGFSMEKEGGKRAAKKRAPAAAPAASSPASASGNGRAKATAADLAATAAEGNGGAPAAEAIEAAEPVTASAAPPPMRLEALRSSRLEDEDETRAARDERRAERRRAREVHAAEQVTVS